MPWIALKRLRWGDGHIEPGEPVPDGEPGRNYDGMVRLGEIAEAGAVAAVVAERDALRARIAELEAAPAGQHDATIGAPPAAGADEDMPAGWTDLGGGWFQHEDGRKVHGRKALAAATS